MKPMDDVWQDISGFSYFHHPTTTNHFQDFFVLAEKPDEGTNFHLPFPPWPLPPPPPTTMLSLSTSGNSDNDQEPPQTTSTTTATSPVITKTSPPPYTEKFKRLMKNRESAARSRARKQARADELEHEVLRLMKENAKLKRLQNELFSSTAQFPKNPVLHRSKSAPL